MKIEVQGKGLSEAFLRLVMAISVDHEPPLNMYIRRENAFAGKLFLVARARANNALNCISVSMYCTYKIIGHTDLLRFFFGNRH